MNQKERPAENQIQEQPDNPANQTALVTGASRGIGQRIALKLAAAGRYVYINYATNRDGALETLAAIEAAGGRGELICFDVADPAQAEAGVAAILERHGHLDVLVNNAGITHDTLMVRMKPEAWQRVIDTNLTGFYNVTRLAVKAMIRKRFGRIVNITSAAGQMGQAGQVNYAASKAGLIGATKALAREVASRNITVNAVSPGFIETDMIRNLALDEAIKAIPMQRTGDPGEVAAAVAFFCSAEASYITGQVLGVNGGIV